jgi:hypothetical protein
LYIGRCRWDVVRLSIVFEPKGRAAAYPWNAAG